MSASARPRFPIREAALTAACGAVVLVAGALLVLGMQVRDEIAGSGRQLARDAASIAPSLANGDVGAMRVALGKAGIAGRVTAAHGQELARTGPRSLWRRGAAPWPIGLALIGTGGFSAEDGSVRATAPLSGGRRLETARQLPPGAGGVAASTLAIALGTAVGLALAAGALVGWLAARRQRDLRRLTAAAEGLAIARPVPPGAFRSFPMRRLGAALELAAERTGRLQEVADAELSFLQSVLAPLAMPVAARLPSGARFDNAALERLAAALAGDDACSLEHLVGEELDGAKVASRRLTLADGRILEVEAWPIPGGRLLAVSERTEQERLAGLRRRLAGASARQLRTPVVEIQTLAADLYAQTPSPSSGPVRGILAAADRMERIVASLLRAGVADAGGPGPRRQTLGAAGFLWGLAHEWDKALRQRALRVELVVDPELPEVRTDPALAEEVLTELIDNAAKFTPRGGTIKMLARRGGEGYVAIEVADSGPGLAPEDVPVAAELFFRGRDSESLPGAGLGLGVAAALAERLGGRLVVEPGPGGMARLELPAQTPTGEQQEPALNGASVGAAV